MSVDIKGETLHLVLDDGTFRSIPLDPDIDVGWDQITKSRVDVARNELTIDLVGGDSVTLCLGMPGRPSPLRGNPPIVYLDQNHWVALAQLKYSPEALDPRVRDSAARFTALVEAGKILVPFSSGHLVETVPRGKQRHDVALTMLTLSRGLQMSHPIEVRHRELVAVIAGKDPRCSDVFSFGADNFLSEESGVSSPNDFPAMWKELHRRTTIATAIMATMFDDADDPSLGPGPAAKQRWVSAYSKLASQVHADNVSLQEAQRIAHAALVSDLSVEIFRAGTAVGMGADDLATWSIHQSEAAFGRAPYLSSLRDVLYHRLRNRDDHWKTNDLIDMTYLPCAAGYADLLVGERKFSDHLRRTRRRYPANAEIVSTLAEAVEVLPTDPTSSK